MAYVEKVWKPADIIIIKGGELYWHKWFGKSFDIRIFLDNDADLRVSKRSEGTSLTRSPQSGPHQQVLSGKDGDGLHELYQTRLSPLRRAGIRLCVFHGLQTKRHADIIIPNYHMEDLHNLFDAENETENDYSQASNIALNVISQQIILRVDKIALQNEKNDKEKFKLQSKQRDVESELKKKDGPKTLNQCEDFLGQKVSDLEKEGPPLKGNFKKKKKSGEEGQ